MGKSKKSWRRIFDSEYAMLFCPGPGLVRVLTLASILMLLLYSLVFHHFVIILVILFQVLALIGTFF